MLINELTVDYICLIKLFNICVKKFEMWQFSSALRRNQTGGMISWLRDS